MDYALQTVDVTKLYNSDSGTVRAVDDVSLDINRGEFVALVGPSGSGKTTLLAMLAGLLRPTEGTILIDGRDLTKMSDAERTAFRREKIGFTFQSNNLVPYLTAQENVELMLRLNARLDRAGRQKATELLERLGLGERSRNLPRQLSGGQQQRVAIARALIHDPAVVLADEPTASLDTERAFQVVEAFSDIIREQNRAGVMVTHDLRMVRYTDRVIQMRDGQVARIVSDPFEIAAIANSGAMEPPTMPLVEPAPRVAASITVRQPDVRGRSLAGAGL
jgi:putative ABC transport system ATP-binding protein